MILVLLFGEPWGSVDEEKLHEFRDVVVHDDNWLPRRSIIILPLDLDLVLTALLAQLQKFLGKCGALSVESAWRWISGETTMVA